MDPDRGYSDDFYSTETRWARESAAVLVPFLVELCAPRSVVDVGCGLGAWLAAFLDHGIDDVLGIDGDWVDPARLLIPAARFRSGELTQPIVADRRFDLVLSLEVAEHLPGATAGTFVASLCGLGDVVVFGAAIPGQGGRHHVNEQWPVYWVSRFAHHGYVPLDLVRPRFWSDPNCAWFYAQNTLLFVNANGTVASPALASELDARSQDRQDVPALVHPGIWDAKRLQPLHEEHSASELARALVARARKGARVRSRRWGRFGRP